MLQEMLDKFVFQPTYGVDVKSTNCPQCEISILAFA
jgi:hypothetical protein